MSAAGQLHAVVHDGHGPFALLVHGLLGSRSYWLDNLEIAELDVGHPVNAHDPPGWNLNVVEFLARHR